MRWGRPDATGILGMEVIQEVDDDEDESQADSKDGERSLSIPSRLATPRPQERARDKLWLNLTTRVLVG